MSNAEIQRLERTAQSTDSIDDDTTDILADTAAKDVNIIADWYEETR
jgi:hypothetical protein